MYRSTPFQGSFISAGVTLPLGVTLQAIDGETLSGLTQSNNYYGRNGFSVPASTSFGALSWDNPNFFPLCVDYAVDTGTGHGGPTTTFFDLGLNTTMRVTANAGNNAYCNTNAMWAVDNDGVDALTAANTSWHIEEPSDQASIDAVFTTAGPSGLAGRFTQLSTVSAVLDAENIGGVSMPTTMSELRVGGSRHVDIVSADIFFFSGSPNVGSSDSIHVGNIYNLGGNASTNQMARGSNYGDMIDIMRTWTVTFPAPTFFYIENSNSLLGTGSREILPKEWNWATWSALIHGARWVVTFGSTGNFQNQFGFNPNILTGQSISLYNQAKNTHGLITNLAPILNSPFALSYASVSPAGYAFPTINLVMGNGIEIMTKWFQGGPITPSSGPLSGVMLNNGFYIFACVRGDATQTNISATFTLISTAPGSNVSVINESRSLTISNHQFTDTFADAYTVHIYKVN